MVGEHQRILFFPAVTTTWLLLALTVVSTIAEVGDVARLKVLSFGGNGNIGSAVLAEMIAEDRFDITMTTRGGWHWDSDTRIGGAMTMMMCYKMSLDHYCLRTACEDCQV